MAINETFLPILEPIYTVLDFARILVGGVFGIYVIMLILRIKEYKEQKKISKKLNKISKDIELLKEKIKK